ncbi:hypothetical protein E3N88_33111 [Mikania micrantha]|uniref:Uncharacterized protein n=1 Tax=Mikania micrantha TaxID=192012 RepID=A0A5N6MBM4_9ASTR|nr:hypothetical protein E3N88_33111 [Mikania micrantha]
MWCHGGCMWVLTHACVCEEQGGGGGGWCSRVPPPSFFKVYKLHNGLLWLPMVKKGCNRASGTRNVERLRRVPRSTVKKVLRVARRISGFKFSETRRVPRMGFLLGHRDTPWTRLFDLADLPTYRLITVEFLSTFRYRAHQAAVREEDDAELPPDIEFSLCGQHFEMSIERFAVHLGIYYEPETVRDDFAQGLTQGEEGGQKKRTNRIRQFGRVVSDKNASPTYNTCTDLWV